MKPSMYFEVMKRLIFLIGVFYYLLAFSSMSVRDDIGNLIQLNQPAHRIITLAPHLTEIVAAAGASQYIVGMSSFSDYPKLAKSIPQVDTANSLNLELIVALKPDLIVAWHGGNPAMQLAKLKALHLPIYESDPKTLLDIPKTILNIGKLAGTQRKAKQNAQKFIAQYYRLQKQYASQPKVTVFYQLSTMPLLTINQYSLINQVLELCGGKNIFAKTRGSAPEITFEAVLQQNPDLIITNNRNNLSIWQKWPSLKAVKNHHLAVINPDLIERFGPRMMLGTETICKMIHKHKNIEHFENH